MDVRNCKNCGRMFNYMGGKQICPECKAELEKKFQAVKDYVYNNPKASIGQVADDMEVTVKQIREWVREDRLILSEATVDGVTCEHCGRPIRSGRFCEKCKAAMTNSFNDAIRKPQAAPAPAAAVDDKDKMRFMR